MNLVEKSIINTVLYINNTHHTINTFKLRWVWGGGGGVHAEAVYQNVSSGLTALINMPSANNITMYM